MPKTQNQPLEHPDPPEVATKEGKHQKAEVSAEESPENQQSEETTE